MDIDLTEVEPDKIGKGGDFFPVGQFHVQVNSVEEWAGNNNDSTLVQFECLASNLPKMEGHQHNEYFAMTPKAVGRLLQLAVACRLVTRDDLKKQKEATGKISIDWTQATGRQCLVITEEEEYKGKVRSKINYNIFDVEDSARKTIPKNETYLARFLQMCPKKADGNGKPAPAAEPALPATAEGDLNDMFA